jgi:hypothetical protein
MIGLSDLLINHQGHQFLREQDERARRSAYQANLTDEQARPIRKDYDNRAQLGMTLEDLGRKYGKKAQAIGRIGRRASYQWVD